MTEPGATNTRRLAADDWAGDAGARWLSQLDRFESMIVPVGDALLAQAAFAPGERVVDVGCGGGWTTRRIAKAVGPGGLALGVDISRDLVSEATARAAAEGLENIRFLARDAATTMPSEAPFDHLFSRFGCMFFPEPYAAFANLRRMLRDGARLDIAVWAPAFENDWTRRIMAVVGEHFDLSAPTPRAPGPFALGEIDYLNDLLERAGFEGMTVEAWEGDQAIGGVGADPEGAAHFVLGAMHIGDLVRDRSPEVRAAVEAGLVHLFEQHRGPDGVRMGAKAWLMTAAAGQV